MKATLKEQSTEQSLFDEHYATLLKICSYTANKMFRMTPCLDLDELTNIGLTACYENINRWDPDKAGLQAFLHQRIRGAMIDHVRSMDIVPRLERQRAKLLRQYDTGEASDEELCNILDCNYTQLHKLRNPLVNLSLSSPMDANTDSFDGNWNQKRYFTFLEDESLPPDARLETMDTLRLIMKGCDKKERLLIIGYYIEGETMKEIGKQLDLSESRISQMHSALLPRIQKRLQNVCE